LLNSAFELLARAAGAGPLRQAGLRHEALDHAVEHDAIVKASRTSSLIRATWPGARSGRISMVTGPLRRLEDQSILVSAMLSSPGLKICGELDRERPAGKTALTHGLGKWHRRAALQRLHHGNPIQ